MVIGHETDAFCLKTSLYLHLFAVTIYLYLTYYHIELPVIHIGHSKGISLSKSISEKYSIGYKVELILEKSYLILKPKTEPRKGWEKAFKRLHQNGDDRLLINDIFEDETITYK